MRFSVGFVTRVYESYTRSVRRSNLKLEDFEKFFGTLSDMSQIPRFQATYKGHLLSEWKMTPGIAAILPPCEVRVDISNSLAKSIRVEAMSEDDLCCCVSGDEESVSLISPVNSYDLIGWNNFIAQLNATINTPSTPLNLSVDLETAIAAANLKDIEDRLYFKGHVNWDGTKTIWPICITLDAPYEDAYYNGFITDVMDHFVAFDVLTLLK